VRAHSTGPRKTTVCTSGCQTANGPDSGNGCRVPGEKKKKKNQPQMWACGDSMATHRGNALWRRRSKIYLISGPGEQHDLVSMRRTGLEFDKWLSDEGIAIFGVRTDAGPLRWPRRTPPSAHRSSPLPPNRLRKQTGWGNAKPRLPRADPPVGQVPRMPALMVTRQDQGFTYPRSKRKWWRSTPRNQIRRRRNDVSLSDGCSIHVTLQAPREIDATAASSFVVVKVWHQNSRSI